MKPRTLQLPKNLEQRRQIIDLVKQQLEKVKNIEQPNIKHIKKLQLRLNLITSSQELTQQRINNLQEIFKYYCTHIFKTGKYMTFQRLQYQKIHLTMDRFFTFIKDFKLTIAQIDSKNVQIIQKSIIILLFKKISSNSRDLNFEEFIKVVEQYAILYFDEKDQYTQKKNLKENIRLKRLQKYKVKMYEKIKFAKQKAKSILQNYQLENKKQQQDDNFPHEEQQSKSSNKQQNKAQNDDFVNQLMKDSQLDHQSNQIEKIIEKNYEQLNQLQKSQNQKSHNIQNQDKLNVALNVTNDEKIQYLYKLIYIDNPTEYRKKMSNLGNPKFYTKPYKKGNYQLQAIKITQQRQQDPSSNHSNKDSYIGIIQLKSKLEQRKQKPKQNSKKIIKQSKRQFKSVIENLNQRQKNLQSQQSLIINGKLNGPISLTMVNKLSLQQLKIPKFSPHHFFIIQQDDKKFLQEYSIPKTKSKLIMNTNKQQSKSVIDGLKKRTKQIEKLQNKKQQKLTALSKRVNYRSQKISVKY